MQPTLQDGIKAARQGDAAEAQRILREVLAQDERNELAWLWLSGVVATDEERWQALQRALAINPNSVAARRGLAKLGWAAPEVPLTPQPQASSWPRSVKLDPQPNFSRLEGSKAPGLSLPTPVVIPAEPGASRPGSQPIPATRPDTRPAVPSWLDTGDLEDSDWLSSPATTPAVQPGQSDTQAVVVKAIAAVQRGERAGALRMLLEVVQADERNELAWLWLTEVVTSEEDRRVALENVLAINPNNPVARRGLEMLALGEVESPSMQPGAGSTQLPVEPTASPFESSLPAEPSAEVGLSSDQPEAQGPGRVVPPQPPAPALADSSPAGQRQQPPEVPAAIRQQSPVREPQPPKSQRSEPSLRLFAGVTLGTLSLVLVAAFALVLTRPAWLQGTSSARATDGPGPTVTLAVTVSGPLPTATPIITGSLVSAPATSASTATAIPTATATPRGWTQYKTESFEIWLPSYWEVIAPTTDDVQAMYKEITNRYPGYARIIPSPDVFKDVKLWAMNPLTGKNVYIDNFNIRLFKLEGFSTVRYILDNMPATYEQLGMNIVNSRELRIGGLPAAQLDINSTGTIDNPPFEAIQYILLNGSRSWIMTYSTAPSRLQSLRAIFEQSAQTFRVKPD